jgi:hypothetical protein
MRIAEMITDATRACAPAVGLISSSATLWLSVAAPQRVVFVS